MKTAPIFPRPLRSAARLTLPTIIVDTVTAVVIVVVLVTVGFVACRMRDEPLLRQAHDTIREMQRAMALPEETPGPLVGDN